MDELWLPETEDQESVVPAAGLGRSWDIWIDGVRISPYDCPDCLRHSDLDCDLCLFFAPETCRLLRDPVLMRDTRTIFEIHRSCPKITSEFEPLFPREKYEVISIQLHPGRQARQRAAQRAAQVKRQKQLIHAIRSELQAHGRPLHYAVLTRMVADRHPKLQVSEHRVYKIMAYHPEVFERVTAGVYRCKKASKRRR